MPDSDPLIVAMSRTDFLAWLHSGAGLLPPAAFSPAADDVYVQLPPKYAAWLKRDHPVVALIDEIVTVSQATPEMTKEFGILLHNLGESWLPVRYVAVHQAAPPAHEAQHQPSAAVADSAACAEAATAAEPLLNAESPALAEPLPAAPTQQPARKKKRAQADGANGGTKRSPKRKSGDIEESAPIQSPLLTRSDAGEDTAETKG